MIVRVSTLEAFRRWREDGRDADEFIDYLINKTEPTKKMLAGTAFHGFLERSKYRTPVSEINYGGLLFSISESMELEIPLLRELRGFKRYGDIIVTGCVDAIYGSIVYDHKTTANFDAESYWRGCQWRFYLDIFDAEKFVWNIFEVYHGVKTGVNVKRLSLLSQYRYANLERDNSELVESFHIFTAANGIKEINHGLDTNGDLFT